MSFFNLIFNLNFQGKHVIGLNSIGKIVQEGKNICPTEELASLVEHSDEFVSELDVGHGIFVL